MTTITKTLCPYCGVGCGLEVVAENKVRGDRSHVSSLGMVCVKGATTMEAMDKDRLLYPFYRQSLANLLPSYRQSEQPDPPH